MAFICPQGDEQWYKFNDKIVTKCTAVDAIEENYGDDCRSSNAYILVYVKTSCIHQILRDVPLHEVTEAPLIQQQFTKEIDEWENKHKFYEFIVFTPDTLTKTGNLQRGKYLFDPNHGLQVRIEKERNFGELRDMIAAKLEMHGDYNMVIWLLNLEKKSIRSCDAQLYLNKPLRKLCNKDRAHFFVEVASVKHPAVDFQKNKQALVFIKQYDSKLKRLKFHKQQYFQLTDTVADICTSIENDIGRANKVQNIVIIADEVSGEEYAQHECALNEPISKIALKFSDTYSAIIVFEIVQAGRRSSYIECSKAQRPSKQDNQPEIVKIENGIHVVVQNDAKEEYMNRDFYPTDQISTIVDKLSEILVGIYNLIKL